MRSRRGGKSRTVASPDPSNHPVRTAATLPLPSERIEVVAVGASAGGVEALVRLVGGLPGDLAAAVFIVLHIGQSGTSTLARILDRAGALPAATAIDGEPVDPGRIYVAPPGFQLTLAGGTVSVRRSPRENGHRPAVDPLFRSAAEAFGPRAAAVVLSGTRDDGTRGLATVKRLGGVTLVQDPDEARYDGMPRSGLTHVEVDGIMRCDELAAAIVALTRHADQREQTAPARLHPLPGGAPSTVRPSRFVCPDCGGVLSERREGEVEYFRCSVGHAWSFETLFAEQADQLEAALWAAVRSLEDRAVLLRRMAHRAVHSGRSISAGAMEQRAGETAAQAATLRSALARVTTAVPDAPDDVASDQ